MVVEAPLSRLARPAVQPVLLGVMRHIGDRFSENLCSHLGIWAPTLS